MDIARGEMVEKELNAMIERRSRQKDPQEDSDLWQESAKAYEENAGRWRASSGISTTRRRLKGSAGPWRRWQTTMRSKRRS